MQVQMQGLLVSVGLCEWAVEKNRHRRCSLDIQPTRPEAGWIEGKKWPLHDAQCALGGQLGPRVISAHPSLDWQPVQMDATEFCNPPCPQSCIPS